MSLPTRTRSGRWAIPLATLLLAAGVGGISLRSAPDAAEVLEYKVKGGYLFNFARFIEWPSSAFPSAQSPFVIGVLDRGEAASVVRSLLAGKSVDGRPVVVRAVTVDQICQDLHILLVTRAARTSAEEITIALGAATTLLVGETEQFAERGGAVGFMREDESIRLALNLERTMEAQLKVSSKLSSVAKLVKTKRNQ